MYHGVSFLSTAFFQSPCFLYFSHPHPSNRFSSAFFYGILSFANIDLRGLVRINIREIARLCNVSVATVSRAINNPELVHAETRQRILRTMQETNYVSSRRSSSVGGAAASRMLLFLFDVEDYVFYKPAFSGFASVLQASGHTMLYAPISTDPLYRSAQLESLSRQRYAGIVWALRDYHEAEIAWFTRSHTPIVLARKYDRAPSVYPRCYSDFSEATFRLTSHLLSLGRRKIALLVEQVSFQFAASYCGGWRRAFFEQDLPFDERWILNTPNTVEGGYQQAWSLLQGPDAPDALCCASNEMAFGALRAARDLGVPVPEQIAIVGFTDSPVAMLSEPELTTIRQPIQQLGSIAAHMLLDLIDSPADAVRQPQEVVLQPQLCIRKSCGAKLKEPDAQ